MKIGYSLSAEQFNPSELLDQAKRARDAGFEALAISDHFHPWNEARGNSAFVWSMIGALSQLTPELPVTTMVTCPIVRINPVILAQAAATSAVLLSGKFVFGVGTGENLNEHVWGAPWPPAAERIARLREAIDLMRLLWTGENIDFDGDYYRAVNARIYTLPDEPPPVYVSGLAPTSTELAARRCIPTVGYRVESRSTQQRVGPAASHRKRGFNGHSRDGGQPLHVWQRS